jgi:hypothetical protein
MTVIVATAATGAQDTGYTGVMTKQTPCRTEHIRLNTHFGFFENGLKSFLDKHFLLGRAAGSVEKYMRQGACPKKRSYLREKLVTDAILHRDRGLKKRVDSIGKDIRALPARCH